MTQQEHLLLIRAKCVELLELAKRRTPGRHVSDGPFEEPLVVSGTDYICSPNGMTIGNSVDNAAFIASAAGPFEAALESTVAAIDGHLFSGACSEWCAEPPEYVTQIITSWPLELLQQ